MNTSEGFVSVNPYPRSLIDRIRFGYRNAFDRWLMAWMVLNAVSFVTASLVVPKGIHTPSEVLLATVYALSSFSGFSAGVLCFASFVLCNHVRHLLSSMAFFALGAGAALQGMADLRWYTPAHCGWIMSSAWLVAAVLFAGTAFSESIWRPVNRKQALAQLLLAAIAVSAFPLGVLPYALNANLINTFTASPSGAFVCLLIRLGVDIVTLTMLLFALRGYYCQFRSRDDTMAALMCYFLMPCAVAFLAHAVSMERFDEWWVVAQIFMSGAWIVAAAGAGVENAFAQREVRERFHELEMLRDVSWGLVGAGTARDLLNNISFTLIDKFGAKIAAVYLADEEGKSLEVAAICGPEDAIQSFGARHNVESTDRRPGFHTGHTAKALKTEKTQIAEHVFVDVEFVPWRIIAQDDGCAVSLPLMGPDRTFGVLNVYFADRNFLTNQRLKLIATLAAAATPAIHNAISSDADSAASMRSNVLNIAA